VPRAILTETAFDPAAQLAAFAAANVAAGAIVSFAGQMRPLTRDGAPLAALYLESYRAMTLSSIEDAVAEATARFEVIDVLALHRTGRILPGEPIVFVATAAMHRRAAFDAADWLMDQLKSRILMWKREERSDGTVQWVEPTVDDVAALKRWEQV
jgi:molybdopterin synthase catalytic subunit